MLRLRSTSRVSELIAECDRDVDQKEHKHLRIAIDRCLDLLRRDLKPVAAQHHELYPAASRFATAPPSRSLIDRSPARHRRHPPSRCETSQAECNAIARRLNDRPRERHGYATPLERLDELRAPRHL